MKSKLVATTAAFSVAGLVVVGMAAPASGAKVAVVGSNLGVEVQPSNSPPGPECPGGGTCTFVEGQAYRNGRNANNSAPKTGTLRRVRIISGDFFNGKIQVVAFKKDGSAKVVASTGMKSIQGQTMQNDDDQMYNIVTIKGLKLPIKKNQRLAIQANTHMPAARCSSGGSNTYIYNNLGKKKYQSPSDTSGCWMLVQGFIS